MHAALAATEHRPWPLPARAWALTMGWERLLFLHWRVPAAALRPWLPPAVAVDTFDGSAWVGVVPFRMVRTRARFLPPIPGAHRFLELNVRTYVRAGDRPGVWFFSLDAQSRLAVAAARAGFGLPYFRAAMECRDRGGAVDYRSARRDRRGPAAVFSASWQRPTTFAPAAEGSLAHFLAERYCLFAVRRGRLVVGEVHHAPWELQVVRPTVATCDMTRLLDLRLDRAPDHAMAAAPIEVAAWAPAVVPAAGSGAG